MQKKISIIIVTYNSQEFIDGCLTSIGDYLEISAAQLEVIIVDNSSGQNAAEIKKITEAYLLGENVRVEYIHNTSNLGYGQGNNVGIKASTGEIIGIMNPDIRFTFFLLKDVLKKFENPQLGLLGYKQLGGFNYSFYMKPECRNKFFGFITKAINKLDMFFPKCFYLSGALFFVDKKKFEEAGYFDENIFMYYEEPDIANRLQKLGYKIKYDNTKSYDHLVGERVGWSEVTFNREMDSLLYYLKKYRINTKTYLKTMLSEVKIKLKIAKILKDKERINSFQNEIFLRENILSGLGKDE